MGSFRKVSVSFAGEGERWGVGRHQIGRFFESGDVMSLGEFPVRIPQSQDVTANPLRFGSGRRTRNVGT